MGAPALRHPCYTPPVARATLGSVKDRVILVTGANTGIGRVTAETLAKAGARVLITCRSEDKAAPVLEAVRRESPEARIDFLPLDLGDLDSVRRCGAAFLERGLPLHVLVNNAGLAGMRGKTRSGFEIQFGVNHIGPFLLTQLLLDRLKESAPARIVNVASKAHYRVRRLDFDAVTGRTRTLSGFKEYAVSKLANVLHAAELSRRLEGSGVTTYSLHPGVVASDVWRSVPWPVRPIIKRNMLTVEEGAQTSLHCAASDEAGDETGLYYDDLRPKEPSALASDPTLGRELYERSEAWVGSG